MKKQQAMKQTVVVPRGSVPRVNREATVTGEAAVAINVREQEDSLQVTGNPMAVRRIGAGERLLLITGGHDVTCRGHEVKIDGRVVATVEGTILNAHSIGSVIVVVTSNGFTYLFPSGSGWVVLDPADAIPQLSFTATCVTSSADIEAYTFAEPYSQWRAPLAAADTIALARMLNTAWSALRADALAEGRHTAPMLVRWAVRLKDGTYLWMSDPCRVGDETLVNADRIAANVTTSGSGFTGTEATRLPFVHYALGITVERDIAPEWLPLVAGVDVLATPEANLLTATRSLDYRCLIRTTTPREYVLEMGLTRHSADAIATQLASSPWQVIATAPVSAHMTGSDFSAPLLPQSMTNEQCAAVGTMGSVGNVVCSTAAGGRLYCCTGDGAVIVSAPGNALVEAHRRLVLGARPLALAVVTRPLYSGGFGRYPVYVFTDDGIYAIPQSSASGTLGEARLVDRTVIDAAVAPVEGGCDIWFISRHGHLCRLSGAALTVCQRDVDCVAMAWCNAHGELWMLPSQGNPLVMMRSGRMSHRTIEVVQLLSDPQHAVAVTASGSVLDLEQEQTRGVVPVQWLTHPIALDPLLARAVKRVVWHVTGSDVDLTLGVTGQRGIMAQDCAVSTIVVSGEVSQPLAAAPMAVRARTLTLSLTGQASPGTLVLPVLLYSSKP